MVDAGTILGIVAILLALLVLAIQIWRRGEPITMDTLEETVEEVPPLASEILDVMTVGVKNSEKLKDDGLIDNDEAFQHALAHVEGWFPNLDLDPDLVANTINGIYYGVKQARKQFDLAREQLELQQAQAAAKALSPAKPPTLADAVDEELRRGDGGLSPG